MYATQVFSIIKLIRRVLCMLVTIVNSVVGLLCFQNQLRSFMDSTFEKIQNTERALNVLKKFER